MNNHKEQGNKTTMQGKSAQGQTGSKNMSGAHSTSHSGTKSHGKGEGRDSEGKFTSGKQDRDTTGNK